MRKFIIAVALLGLASVWFWASGPIYVSLSSQQIDVTDGTVYFWAPKRHREFFSVGSAYQLQAEQESVEFELHSIVYATLKPDQIKLGFQPRSLSDMQLNYTEYRVVKHDVDVVDLH